MRFLMAVIVTGALVGCSVDRPKVDGRVLDENGNGVEGALVTIDELRTRYPTTIPVTQQESEKPMLFEGPEVLASDVTDLYGRFSLRGAGCFLCGPRDRYRVRVHRPGFTDAACDFKPTRRGYFIFLPTMDLGDIVLHWYPTDPLLAPISQN